MSYKELCREAESPMPFGDRTEPHRDDGPAIIHFEGCLQCLSAIGLNLTVLAVLAV